MTDETIKSEGVAAEPMAMTPESKAAVQYEENLARARENGYREPGERSREERINAVVTAMEHQIQHNGPITLEMIRELRDILQLPKQPE